jgi:hypothetical protein
VRSQVEESYAKSKARLKAQEEAWDGSLAGETEAVRRKTRTLKFATVDRLMAPEFNFELDRMTHPMPAHIREGKVNVAVQFPAGDPDADSEDGGADAAAAATAVDAAVTRSLAAANTAAESAAGVIPLWRSALCALWYIYQYATPPPRPPPPPRRPLPRGRRSQQRRQWHR